MANDMPNQRQSDRSKQQRIGCLLYSVYQTVNLEGGGVIIKWDGQRDNEKRYTVVHEGGEDNSPLFRVDTDDIENGLRAAFPDASCMDAVDQPQMAALVEGLDQAARENLVISLRMSQSMTEKRSQLVILDPMNRSTIFNQDSTDIVVLLQNAVDFLIARTDCVDNSMKYHDGDYVAVHREPVWRERANVVFHVPIEGASTERCWEQLWWQKLTERQFVLCCIPFFAYDLDLGDEVSVNAERRILAVRRSGQWTFRAWFGDVTDTDKSAAIEAIRAHAPMLEWSSDHLLAISVATEHAQSLADTLRRLTEQGCLHYETGRR